jgi:RNA polymerase sigma-70 factor (ECF subfamily)
MDKTFTESRVKVLFIQYYVALVEFSTHLLNCRETALDIVQDVFVKLLEKEGDLPEQEKFVKSYLYASVKNASLNHCRHLKVVDAYHHQQEWQEDADIKLLDALIYAETINSLYAAIQRLPKSCQEVCRLTYLEGKSNNEAAELCGVSVNTIKTQKRRSVELLRVTLKPIINTIKTILIFLF